MSKAEGKIAFVDLRPLYSYYREMYFTTPENLAKTRDLGPEPKKWPFAFEAEPLCKPHFINTLDVPEPTALRVTPFSHDNHPALAVVGCMDGRLFAYDLSSFTNPSPKGDAPEAKPYALGKVGRNPTCIALPRYADPYRKSTQGSDVGGWFSMSFTVLVTCRGDREIDWVEITPNKVDVYRRLRDSRMLDPVWCQQTRINSPDGAYLLTVTDFKGRKVLNYRIGDASIKGKKIPIPEPKDSKGEKGEVEFTGAMDFPGFPFRVNSDNVP